MYVEPAFANIGHTSGTLVISWFADGAGWQGGNDESWAIDNVQIELVTEPVTVAPTLWAARSGNDLVLSWPMSTQNFVLQATTDLTDPASWITLTNEAVIVNQQITITDAMVGARRFYRLKQ